MVEISPDFQLASESLDVVGIWMREPMSRNIRTQTLTMATRDLSPQFPPCRSSLTATGTLSEGFRVSVANHTFP